MDFIKNDVLARLFVRYLAGGSSLRQTRGVTRAQIALFESQAGFRNQAVLQQAHFNQVFNKAISVFIEHGVSVNSLCRANAILLNSQPDDTIRKVECKVSAPNGERLYIPPPPERIHALMNEYVSDVKCQESSLFNTIINYSRLVNIHPFYDANGRTARAMAFAQLHQEPRLLLSFLYRLSADKNNYFNALHQYGVTSKEYVDCDYWTHAMTWAEATGSQCLSLIESTNKKLTAPFILMPQAHVHLLVIRFLWSQPIVFLPSLAKKLKIRVGYLQSVIKSLCDNKILVPRAMRYPEGTIVFECPQILATFEQIDSLLKNNL
ncbi:Fic family protein [Pseudoalteromonas sp. OOF1S-7]|uniref:Fic family protein n=1 Tax=Pseudoalteromonas sp. OOF1S-7 TaxID=2917757 RepID=UPI001EF4F83E|nr:Fic family protein [Pseudoalteromonas sp. OOF1S-7]MCG7533949.1 Fic family protein [Pseudoalteromonas sp. OOF1S-7]